MDELLPLYLGEAGDRLETMEGLFSRLPDDQEASRLLRRELHTLKGASRMMGLGDLADLCHRGEDLLDDSVPFDPGAFRSLLDELHMGLEQLGSGGDQEDSGAEEVEVEALSPAEPVSTVRIPETLLNELSDQSVRMRVLAQETIGLIDGLHALARTAEHAVSQENQAQVLASLATRLRRVAVGAERSQRRFEAMVEGQYRAFRSLQVQPVQPFLQQLARYARSIGESQAKDFRVSVEAEDCGLDRRIMDALREAMLHIVRNAVDHGLDTPTERHHLGKNERGLIRLKASRIGERIRIEVEDDGRGIDRDSIRETALRRGLLDEAQAESMPESLLLSFLFEPGFSTRKVVSDVSGRGIGLDVVAAAVDRVGGNIWVESEIDVGTRFVLEIPVLYLAEMVLVVDAASFRIAFAGSQVRSFRQLPMGEDQEHVQEEPDSESRRLDLRALWGGRISAGGLVVETRTQGLELEIVVDDIIGEEAIFLKQWPSFGFPARWIDGVALLHDGRPVIVVDLHQLYLESRQPSRQSLVPSRQTRKRRVLLVDDSRITREMLRRALVDGGVDVHAVPSAQAALWYLETRSIDCLLTDIEMPDMNGLELTRRIRATPELSQMPIILISTRNSREDRLDGLNAGADAYLGKQNLDIEELLRMIGRFGFGQ